MLTVNQANCAETEKAECEAGKHLENSKSGELSTKALHPRPAQDVQTLRPAHAGDVREFHARFEFALKFQMCVLIIFIFYKF